MQLSPKPLTLIVGVKDHLEVVNLLGSIDENIEVVVVLNCASSLIKTVFQYLKFDTFTLKIAEIEVFSLGQIKNVGIQQATNDNVFFLDADCVLKKGTLNKIIEFLRNNEIGKANIVIYSDSWLSSVLAKNRIPSKQNSAYTPGLFFKKSIINKIDGYYYRNELQWREDYELNQRIEKNKIWIHFLEDAVVFHPPYRLFCDIKTAFRCGGGQQIGCMKGYIKPTLKYGGGKNFLKSITYDFFRAPYLLTTQFYKDFEKFGFIAAIYKIFWKAVFTLGYYTQLFFSFLNKQ